MTCIIGMEHKGKIYMGADSIASNSFTMDLIRHPKVFIKDDFIIGCTDSFRMSQLLQYQLKLPKHKKQMPDLDFMVCHFAESARTLFKDHGFLTTQNSVDKGGTYLIGYRGTLYRMQEGFSVLQTSLSYDACGSGEYHALAAMDALPLKNKPKKRILKALAIVANRVITVAPPFHILSI